MNKELGTQYNLTGVRALVVGLAREGAALARFLAERGARVTVTDAKFPEALVDPLAALSGLPVEYALGGHPLALLDGVEIAFVSPGVPLEIPLLEEARRRGMPLSSETRLLTRLCKAPILGITGSSGKTTTTALVSEMLKSAGRQTWIGGNIGQPLIGSVEEIAPSDTVVMELSSFQLDFFGPWPEQDREKPTGPGGELYDPAGWSPPIAAILNITPNHLDRHFTMEAYVAAKACIVDHQLPGDVAILNLDNPVTREMGEAAGTERRVLWFSMAQEVREGAFLQDDALILRVAGRQETVCRNEELEMLGQHNVANTLAACALAAAAGVPGKDIRQVATTFGGVEHRLELIREREGVRWYNDSIATTPERTVAALRSFPEAPIVLLAGGRDKHLPWLEMAELAWKRVRHLVLFGEAAALVEEAMQTVRAGKQARHGTGVATQIHHAGTLERSVEFAVELAHPGDVVLLSPGGTSFDAYPNFEVRGEHFRQLVQALE
jgi:UDP-N-acetylmuramoylalanine--D-glutamate ligase